MIISMPTVIAQRNTMKGENRDFYLKEYYLFGLGPNTLRMWSNLVLETSKMGLMQVLGKKSGTALDFDHQCSEIMLSTNIHLLPKIQISKGRAVSILASVHAQKFTNLNIWVPKY